MLGFSFLRRSSSDIFAVFSGLDEGVVISVVALLVDFVFVRRVLQKYGDSRERNKPIAQKINIARDDLCGRFGS